ncbi:c6 transcription factor [Fusarium circinatum]|uniref:C6 transcription factor n=1 Tax=Fusarium circinatum TaxID=48490 RepID=A0A8H5UAA9_FUSCI|nr:c6 transcription factor [Fusarium circinatum]
MPRAKECTFPSRTRYVKVEQRYIDELLDEIERLQEAIQAPKVTHADTVGGSSRAQSSNSSSALTDSSSTASAPSPRPSRSQATDAAGATQATWEPGEAVRNPLLDDPPWFIAMAPEIPVLIGEATDVAFATRLRQGLLGTSQNYFPRTQYINDDTLILLGHSDCPWPSPSRARFLLKVAFSTVCQRFYLVRKSCTIQLLEQAIHNQATCDMLSICKLYALSALGEAYSMRTYTSEDRFPGIAYFVSATRMLRVLSEQPRLECVEIILMLSIYSLILNRLHAAFCIAGYARRLSVILGLHLNFPQHQLDPELQEHRNRVWWTAYILDRSWAWMLGKPVSIQDDDIGVALPSASALSTNSAAQDFADTKYQTAGIRVANLGAQITGSIYSRRTHVTSFSCRVRQALQDLGGWLQELPDPLRTAMDQVPPNAAMPVITLYLYFNQCLILASRPVLLYTLRLRQNQKPDTATSRSPISEIALTLSEACIQCARRSCRILTDSWINGSFPTFEFTYTQCLFSAAVILAISNLLQGSDSHRDGDDFESAADILEQLDQSGNLAAKEFSKHMQAIKLGMSFEKTRLVHGDYPEPGSSANDNIPIDQGETRPPVDISSDEPMFPLAAPLLQDLLSQPELDLHFLESSIIDNGFRAFIWPEE